VSFFATDITTGPCDGLNCSLASGCMVDDLGNATCFCETGYSLLPNNSCAGMGYWFCDRI